MKVICSTDESLYRPEAVRWRKRMELMQEYDRKKGAYF